VESSRKLEVARWKNEPAFAMEAGESVGVRFARVAACLHDIALRHAGGAVAVVAHGGILEEVARLVKMVRRRACWLAALSVPLRERMVVMRDVCEGFAMAAFPLCDRGQGPAATRRRSTQDFTPV
jgi:hypothetical protein